MMMTMCTNQEGATHIIIDSAPPSSKAPLYLAGVSLVISLAALFITLWLSRRTRRSLWFHKIAVDPLLEPVFLFFEQQRTALTDCAVKYQSQKQAAQRKTVGPNITKIMSSFSSDILKLYEQVASRIEVFDVKKATRIRLLLEAHQDAIGAALFKGREEVDASLLNAKVELMKCLRSTEFWK
jgi:hypothetical protein